MPAREPTNIKTYRHAAPNVSKLATEDWREIGPVMNDFDDVSLEELDSSVWSKGTFSTVRSKSGTPYTRTLRSWPR